MEERVMAENLPLRTSVDVKKSQTRNETSKVYETVKSAPALAPAEALPGRTFGGLLDAAVLIAKAIY